MSIVSKDSPGIPTKRMKIHRGPVSSGRHCIMSGSPKHNISKKLNKKGALELLLKDDEKKWATPAQREMLIELADGSYPPKEKKESIKKKEKLESDPFKRMENEDTTSYINRIENYVKQAN
jgi:hypothetical protein